MLKDSSTADTFLVRQSAPNVILVGNLGINQIRDLGVAKAVEVFDSVEVDWRCI